MKLRSIFFLIALLWACETPKEALFNGWEITLSGKVGFPQSSGFIVLEEITDDNTGKKDTILLKSDYTFSEKIRLTEPGYYNLNFYGKQAVSLILDKSNIEVSVDGHDPRGFAEIKGSPDHDLLKKVQEIVSSTQSSQNLIDLEDRYRIAVAQKDQDKIETLQAEYMDLLNSGYDSVASIVQQHPASLATINLLQSNHVLDKDRYFETYMITYDKVKVAWPESTHGKSFIEFVDKMKLTAIGQPAPEISLPNPDGQLVALSSFRGNYVLVDFWAKWCGPCRMENPNVVKAYKKFSAKGFEVLGVSLDRNREDWVRAIAEDGLNWTHISDLNYFNSQAAKDYNINAIPFSILVDPNGIIVAKNLRGPGLHKKLEEIYGSAP